MPACTCYVAKLPREDAFCIRYGAHNQSCPAYRPSRDPVDARNDADLRRKMESEVRNAR